MRLFENLTHAKVAEGLGWLGGCELLSIGLASTYERSIHAAEVIGYPIIAWVLLFFVKRLFNKWFPK